MLTSSAEPSVANRVSRRQLTAILLCVAFCAAGCSSMNPGRQAEPFTFSTRITPDGLKLFELSFPYQPRQLLLPGNTSRAGNSSRAGTRAPRDRQPRYSDRQLERILDTKLTDSGYCREGYILLGRHSGHTVQTLRGECRELATSDDRVQFQDTIGRW